MKNVPILVWVITIYFGFTSLIGLYTYISHLLGFGLDNPALTAAFSSFGVFDYVLVIVKQILVILGCYLLFRLKKQALSIFIAVLAMATISLMWISIKGDYIASIGWVTFLIANVGIGLGLWVAVVLYIKHLIKKGFLV